MPMRSEKWRAGPRGVQTGANTAYHPSGAEKVLQHSREVKPLCEIATRRNGKVWSAPHAVADRQARGTGLAPVDVHEDRAARHPRK